MKNIIKNRDGAWMKIALLGVAMAISVVMFSKVYFENSYENFVPQLDRTYRVTPIYVQEGVVNDSYNNLPGGIVQLLADYSPQVEKVTRYTELTSNCVFARTGVAFEDSKPTRTRALIAADTMLFDIFPTEVVGENPKTTLSNIGSILISRSLAEKMSKDGDPRSMIDVSIECISNNYGQHTVKGIFEDFPENSDLRNIDVIATVNIMGSGKDGVLGNDRYQSFVQLIEGANLQEVESALEQVKIDKIMPQAKEWGMDTDKLDILFKLKRLSEYHSGQSDIKVMTYMLLILAISMLLIAILNYVLIAVTALVKKAKNIATRRCYGASTWVIYRMLIGEALVTILLSLAVAAFIIFALREEIEEIVAVDYSALFGWNSIWIVGGTSLFVLTLCGLVPAMLYSKIPLSAAFRRYKESRAKWKHALLALQFSGAMLFVSLLMVITLQYSYVLNLDMGYNYDNILGVQVNTLTPEERKLVKDELGKIAEVKLMSYSSDVPLGGGSGNEAQYPEDITKRFTIQDLYSADENYIDLLGLEIVQGRNFSKESPVGREVLVSESFVTYMKKQQADWGENPIGKEVIFSEHSQTDDERYTICGVFKGFKRGTAYYRDERPQVLFFSETENDFFKNFLYVLMIKLSEENPEIIAKVNSVLQELLPEKMLEVQSYSDEVEGAYKDSKMFRNMIFYAGLIVLIITLIGLIGYTRDEIARRRAEIAIRKIHGATTGEVIQLFLRDTRWLLLFGLVAGGATTYFASGLLLEMFAYKIALSWWIFALSALLVTVIITTVVVLTTHKAADANPVENLKSE